MDDIDRLRDFNRLYTRELGLLGKSYLGSSLGVAEVRVLYELGHGGAASGREIARRLGLDEGYVSRTLKGFARRGWITRGSDPADGRRRVLTMTAAGRAALDPLEDRSRAEIADRLGQLDLVARRRLLQGADEMRAALTGPPTEVALGDLLPGDLGWVAMRHGALYASDEGYDQRFEALVAGILSQFVTARDPRRERGWVARAGGQRLGCIFCVRETDEVARLRLFLVEPDARGQGIGRALFDACLGFARDRGYRRMILWTHKSHTAACAIYAANGFRVTSEAPGHAFGTDVVDQTWERDL